MKRILPCLSVLGVLALAGCQTTYRVVPQQKNGITQVATIDALMAGVYDGHLNLMELRRHGDFGLGTFDRLDGEMLLLDGIFHQVRVDGVPRTPEPRCTTPFACVTFFQLNKMEVLNQPMNMKALEDKIDAMVPDQHLFCAIKVRGNFTTMKIRSVPAQEKPYRPLAEVTKEQTIFDNNEVRGTLVGFRTPPFAKGLNVAGYHFHFIADDRSAGGHVLDFELGAGELEIDSEHEFITVLLPQDRQALRSADLSIDRSGDPMSVETLQVPEDGGGY